MPKETKDSFTQGIRNPHINLEPFLAEELNETELPSPKIRQDLKYKDNEIYKKVCETLYSHPEIETSGIIFTVKDAEVTLSGKVPDPEMKKSIENFIAEVPGVWEVYSEIQVPADS